MVLAPTDDAFNALPDGTLDFLRHPENQSVLQEILGGHLVSGVYPFNILTDGQELTTLTGETITVSVGDEVIMLNDASIVGANGLANNGIVHAINAVLLFEPDETNVPSDIPSDAPSGSPSNQPSEMPSNVPTIPPDIPTAPEPTEKPVEPEPAPTEHPTYFPVTEKPVEPEPEPTEHPTYPPKGKGKGKSKKSKGKGKSKKGKGKGSPKLPKVGVSNQVENVELAYKSNYCYVY
jgi:hypothetical protein